MTRTTPLLAALGAALLLGPAGCELPFGDPSATETASLKPGDKPAPPALGKAPEPGQIWVANRADGTVSVVDADDAAVVDTLALPGGGEPMYVNYSGVADVVFVGDRANDRVVAFDAVSREVVAAVPAGAGVFHQWALPDGAQLWVNNDVDRTTTVVDTGTFELLATVPMPADLAAMPGAPKPHDVLVSPDGAAAFVSYLGFDGPSDYVVRFDAATFTETHRAPVGKDPHLSATPTNGLLYVPCQETDEVVVLERATLAEVTRLALPGAHGAGMSPEGDRLYLTNLPSGGPMALFALDTATSSLVSDTGVDAPMVGVPHNVALSADGKQVFVTHSGPDSYLLSVYGVSAKKPLPKKAPLALTAGKNPFGLGLVPAASPLPPGAPPVGPPVEPPAGPPVEPPGPPGPPAEPPGQAGAYKVIQLDVSALGTLRDGHHYEGWAILDGAPVSFGKFNVDASGAATDLAGIAIMGGMFDAGRDLSGAEAFVITIEEPGDLDIVPNDTHYVAGDLDGLSATLTVGHPAALGADFADAMGMFVLATPTDGADSHETSGVWFLNLQMATPKPGLLLPTLPAGWAYEGWAVIDGQPVSTGRFLDPAGPDDAAPFSGPYAGPPFPGEDFLVGAPDGLSFPTDLSGASVVISVEPEPDDHPDPFLLKPLVGVAPTDANHHQTFYMSEPAPPLPVVTATLLAP